MLYLLLIMGTKFTEKIILSPLCNMCMYNSGRSFFLLILKCSIIDPNWKEEGSFLTSRQKQKKLSKMPYPLSRNNITEPKAKSGRTAKDWMIMEFL